MAPYPVGQHERAALQRPLASDGILVHSCREAHRRGTLAGGVHRAVRHLLHVLEELQAWEQWVLSAQGPALRITPTCPAICPLCSYAADASGSNQCPTGDLAVPGSPSSSMLMSPRSRWVAEGCFSWLQQGGAYSDGSRTNTTSGSPPPSCHALRSLPSQQTCKHAEDPLTRQTAPERCPA